mmetsp:Transcript_5580/g.16955  ORF Transcript_5580/g.16955 Transcript_5580/m.16955 type:complete len:255 (-) Transcript_5580:687-1451(-)
MIVFTWFTTGFCCFCCCCCCCCKGKVGGWGLLRYHHGLGGDVFQLDLPLGVLAPHPDAFLDVLVLPPRVAAEEVPDLVQVVHHDLLVVAGLLAGAQGTAHAALLALAGSAQELGDVLLGDDFPQHLQALLPLGDEPELGLLPRREDDLEDPPDRPEDPAGVDDVRHVQHPRVVLLVDLLNLLEDVEGVEVGKHPDVEAAEVQNVAHAVHRVPLLGAGPREQDSALVLLSQDVDLDQVVRGAVPEDLPVEVARLL